MAKAPDRSGAFAGFATLLKFYFAETFFRIRRDKSTCANIAALRRKFVFWLSDCFRAGAKQYRIL
jgi:hypothetical protein